MNYLRIVWQIKFNITKHYINPISFKINNIGNISRFSLQYYLKTNSVFQHSKTAQLLTLN